MNKISFFAGISITVFALVGIAYSALNPVVDTCAPPTENGMRSLTAVCARQETVNRTGVGVSLTVLVSGIVVVAYSLRAQKNK